MLLQFQHHDPSAEYQKYSASSDHNQSVSDISQSSRNSQNSLNSTYGSDNRNESLHETVRHFNHEKKLQYASSKLHRNICCPWLIQICSIVENKFFKAFIVCMIIVNTVHMGVATLDFVTDYDNTYWLFHTIDIYFMFFFTMEIVMQLIYHGMRLFRNPWQSFDVSLVVLTWIFMVLPTFHEFRAIRVFRLVVKIKEIRNLVSALIGATGRIVAVQLLLLIIFYIFGVIFTLLFKDLQEDGYTDEDYFSRLDITFFTLFQFLTMDAWTEIAKQVMVPYPWAWAPICTFIILTSFVVINLVIAVICESVGEVQRQEMEQNLMQMNSMITTAEEHKTTDMIQLEKKVDRLQGIIEELRNEIRQQQQHHVQRQQVQQRQVQQQQVQQQQMQHNATL